MMPKRELVFVVEDDPVVRQSLVMLIETLGVAVRGHATGRGFLDDPDGRRASCVVLDVRLPGLGGLEVQSRMSDLGLTAPVIFITGHGDVPMAVAAMRGGAVDFLQKPFDNQSLLERVGQAIARGRDLRQEEELRKIATARLATLSPREREVLALLVEGRMNKAIAAELGISSKTVEDHRASIMRKMQVRSIAELVRLVADSRPRTAQ
jgi:RNA polymerase sigma factor (sigma-70 family)